MMPLRSVVQSVANWCLHCDKPFCWPAARGSFCSDECYALWAASKVWIDPLPPSDKILMAYIDVRLMGKCALDFVKSNFERLVDNCATILPVEVLAHSSIWKESGSILSTSLYRFWVSFGITSSMKYQIEGEVNQALDMLSDRLSRSGLCLTVKEYGVEEVITINPHAYQLGVALARGK